MARNERMLLVIKNRMATAAISSIIVASLSFRTFKDVSTIKQKPSRFDDVLRICCELLFLLF